MYDFSTATDRSNSLSVKWDRNAIRSICNNADALPFWVADMDFQAPPSVVEALQEQVTHGILGYPAVNDTPEVFVQWAERRHQWNVQSSEVIVSPGMLASVAALVELLSSEGDQIILPMPAYQPFVHIIRNLNRRIAAWPMHYDEHQHQFSCDMALLEHLAQQADTSLLIFCSPHNPTGRVFTPEELQEVAAIVHRHDIAVISDEIHADLTLPGYTHTPFDVIAREKQIVCATCMAPSKTFNIAGEHLSVVVCSTDELTRVLRSRFRALHLSPDLLATITAIGAYRGGYEWLQELREHLRCQVSLIQRLLEEQHSELHFVTPEASFIGFLDCSSIYDAVVQDERAHPELYDRKISPSGGLLSRFFGQRAKVAMNDGTWFGADYARFVRFNYGTSESAVTEAIMSIVEAERSLH